MPRVTASRFSVSRITASRSTVSRSTVSRPYDVIVLGAGAAGLAAADELAAAGRSVLVLEARDRVGGRAWSLDVPGLPVPVEMGPEFIHGRPEATFSLLRETGGVAVDRSGDGWYTQGGKLEPTGEIFAEVRAAIREAGPPRKDVSFETYLHRELAALSPRARAFARRRVEGYDAADPARASARAIIEEWSGEDDSAGTTNFRPLGGYGPLMEKLAGRAEAAGAELRLDTVVRTVTWKRGTVEVEGESGGVPFRAAAKRTIVTLPLGVLQQRPAFVRFFPALDVKRTALRGLAPSPVIKVSLLFRDAFWERLDRGRYADAIFFRALKAPFPTFWTALPMRAPLLTAWAGGPRAGRLAGRPARHVIRQAVASLAQVFGPRARVESRLVSAWLHDWQADPYARGAYSYVTVGGQGARKALAAPVRGTLYFAGEASDYEGEHGTVAGALRSGVRAARQVMSDE